MQQPTALEEVLNSNQLHVVFQPIVELPAGKVFAYEALVRCKDTRFSNPHALFTEAIKERRCGELGRKIREIAVKSCSGWPVFLNIHPNELDEGWLVRPDDPIFLHEAPVFLEITESVPITHFAFCHGMLREIRSKGVHVAVDDLGAGYSNLRYIADLTPEIVKLDRSLIMGLTQSSRLFNLVRSLVNLCDELGARVVAEGIETAEELDAVMASGAHYAQGYYLARPAYPLPRIDSSAVTKRPSVK